MHFYLQKDEHTMDKEIIDLKFILNNFGNQYMHDMDELYLTDIKDAKFGPGINIPVGTLEFVSAYLEKIKGTGYMQPLEIPEFLRKEEYLKRFYTICKFADLPKYGTYFIKDATYLKSWEANIFFMPCINDLIPKSKEDWEIHDYVCSEVIDTIYSEYRVLVHEDIVLGVQYYSGFQTRDVDSGKEYYVKQTGCNGVLHFPDSEVIRAIVEDIKTFRLHGGIFPKAYTLDIAVTPRGTILLEIHNFISCGTYGFCEKDLIYMYRDGIEYEINRN